MTQLIESLGATAVRNPAADQCCGSYQILGNPDAAASAVSGILGWAEKIGADALAMSCPLCEFNIGKKQGSLIETHRISKEIPTFYFTQLLALALGLDKEICHFELNNKASIELLKTKNLIN